VLPAATPWPPRADITGLARTSSPAVTPISKYLPFIFVLSFSVSRNQHTHIYMFGCRYHPLH
jgi:hypothetical protein